MALKLRTLVKFPSAVETAAGLAVARAGGIYTLMLDWMGLAPVTSVTDLASRHVVLVSDSGGNALYERIALDDLVVAAVGTVQVVSTTGTHAIGTATALVIVDPQGVGTVTLTLPEAAAKTGAVEVIDWAQKAGANPITIARQGSEKFNGLSQDWLIAADGAAARFIPYPGRGYAVR